MTATDQQEQKQSPHVLVVKWSSHPKTVVTPAATRAAEKLADALKDKESLNLL